MRAFDDVGVPADPTRKSVAMTPPSSSSSALASGIVALAATAGLLLGGTPALAESAARAPVSAVSAVVASGATLLGGDELAPGGSIVSPSGGIRFVMQADGNAVAYRADGHATWSTGTQGRGDHLAMQTDGNLVVYDAADRPVWFNGTAGEPGARLTVQDDGNLVVYRADGSPAWASSVDRPIPRPEIRELTSGQELAEGQRLTNGATQAVLQADGNLVVLRSGSVLWSSRTSGSGNRLVMQRDGNAVINASAGTALWSSGTAGSTGAVLRLNDGELDVVSDRGALWSSIGQTAHDTLRQEDSVLSGDQLTSSSGVWRAVMQRDGNVVVYGARGADWSTGTSVPRSTLSLLADGRLQVYSYEEGVQWTASQRTAFVSGQRGPTGPYRLVMQDDGNLVEYDGLGRPVWASRGL